MRCFRTTLLLVLTLGSFVAFSDEASALTAPSPGVDRLSDWGCDHIDPWYAGVEEAFDENIFATNEVASVGYLADRHGFVAAEAEIKHLITDLDEMAMEGEVPRAALDLHNALGDLLLAHAAFFEAAWLDDADLQAEANAQIAGAMRQIDVAWNAGHARCGAAWSGVLGA